MFRAGLMWGAARLPPCSRLPCSSCFLRQAVSSVAMGCRPQEGNRLLLWGALLGWSIPPSSLSAVEPRGTQIHACRFMPALGAGRELTALCALSPCLQLGAEPNGVGVNKQACPFVRGGLGGLLGRNDSFLTDRDSVALLVGIA